jgi:FKBP-type peptidyl-prolyl cis-trans isomerase FkpA
MKKLFFFLTAFVAFFSSKSQIGSPFLKGEKGVEYQIIFGGDNTPVKNGSFLQIQVKQSCKGKIDSVLSDSRNNMPNTLPLDSSAIPSEYYKIIAQLHKGDSVTVRILTDTIFKTNIESMPPFLQKGDYLYTSIFVQDVFVSRQQADSANRVEQQKMFVKDSIESIAITQAQEKTLANYFEANKITATRAPMGTYIQIIQPGTGSLATDKNTVKVNYTGKTLAGKVFDSNTDKKFGHADPYPVNLGAGGVVAGWIEGLKYFNKGSKGVLYIPSALGYGSRGAGADIGPNEILVFDIELVDITTTAQKPMMPPVQVKGAKKITQKINKKPIAKKKK